MMINKWDSDIKDAIQRVGGNPAGSGGLPDYAGIIRSQLIANNAVGEGIYQDFLFVNDKNETSPYPWEGEATDSTNAVQSSAVAKAIKEIFNVMASTERFNILLVDEPPKGEINLSAVYLIRSNVENNVEENIYSGCYYIKSGKTVKRIDIPDFKINLGELFYLTRNEYDANLPNYIKEIERLVRQKFGKYWFDESFILDETLDQIIADMKSELQILNDRILEDINNRIDNVMDDLDDKIQQIESNLEEKFNTFENSIKEEINGLTNELSEYVKIEDLIALNNEINELK